MKVCILYSGGYISTVDWLNKQDAYWDLTMVSKAVLEDEECSIINVWIEM